MRAIFESSPAAAPDNADAFLLGRIFHRRCNPVVQRPVPPHLIPDPSPKINRMACDVPTVQGLTGPGLNKRLLALWCPQTFEHREVHIGDLNGTFNHFDQIGMNPSQALLGAWAKGEHDQ